MRENTYSSADIYEKGMSVPKSDYTKWHQWFAATVTPEMFASLVEEYERTSPYRGNAKII